MQQLPLDLLTFLIGVQHLGFMALEMFFWRKPLGRKIFGLSREQADQTAVLAMNQGLYNGFLAAGLFTGIVLEDPAQSYLFRGFFLACIVTAGIVGGITANRRILWIQALPAGVALGIHGLGILQ